MKTKTYTLLLLLITLSTKLLCEDYWQLTGYNEDANRVVITDDDTIFASGDLGLKVTYDLGETWEEVEEPPMTNIHSRILYSDNDKLYYAGYGSKLYVSNSLNINWSFIFSSPVNTNFFRLVKFDNNYLISNWGQVIKFDQNFSNPNIVIDGSINQAFYCLAKDSSGTYYAGSGHFTGIGGLYKSFDQGITWEGPYQFENLPDMHVRDIVVNEDGVIFVGTDKKIYRSLDNGETFDPVTGNMNLSIHSMCINSRGDIFAALNSNMIVSHDGGESWEFIGSGLGGAGEISKIVESKDGYLFLSSWSKGIFRSIISTTSVYEENSLISSVKLYQNYPNPFNPVTTITYSLDSDSEVKLVIKDIIGREVRSFSKGIVTSGNHAITFDGSKLASGIYLYTLIVDGKSIGSKRMILVK